MLLVWVSLRGERVFRPVLVEGDSLVLVGLKGCGTAISGAVLEVLNPNARHRSDTRGEALPSPRRSVEACVASQIAGWRQEASGTEHAAILAGPGCALNHGDRTVAMYQMIQVKIADQRASPQHVAQTALATYAGHINPSWLC